MASRWLRGAGAPVAGTAAVYRLAVVGSPTGGNFKLRGPEGFATVAISGMSTSTIQTAVDAAWGANQGVVSNPSGSNFDITQAGDHARVATVPLTLYAVAVTGGSSPSVTLTVTTPGVAATGANRVMIGAVYTNTTNGDRYVNVGTVGSPVWKKDTGATIVAPQTNIPVIGATTNLTGVPGSFADVAAVQAYLAGANVVPRIESRLDTVEGKVDAVLAMLQAAGVMS